MSDKEAYWTRSFTVDDNKYEVKLYHYSAKSIAMTSSEDFGKRFSKYFKEIGGRFNPKLSVGAGWIFKLDSQSDLTEVLRKIFKGEIKPSEVDVRAPVFEDSDVDRKIYNTLQELIHLLPEDKQERVMTENDELRITVYYNKDDETVTQGDCIYEFSSSRKKMSIYQLEL